MPDDDTVVAFRRPEPPPPKPHLEWLRDYGEPCHGMTVSLARASGVTDNGDHFLLNGPDVEPVSLMLVTEHMGEADRDVIGRALYRVLFYATAPEPRRPA